MALPKKRSRKISIDGEQFQYFISRSKVINDGAFHLTVTVQNKNSNGTYLIAKGIQTRDFWLDFGDVQRHAPSEYKILMPKHVEKIIREGLKLGWKSEQNGDVFELNFSDRLLNT